MMLTRREDGVGLRKRPFDQCYQTWRAMHEPPVPDGPPCSSPSSVSSNPPEWDECQKCGDPKSKSSQLCSSCMNKIKRSYF